MARTVQCVHEVIEGGVQRCCNVSFIISGSKRHILEFQNFRAVMSIAEVVSLVSVRKFYPYAVIFIDYRCDQVVRTEHILWHLPIESLSGEFIFHSTDNRFASFCGMPDLFHDVVTETGVQLSEFAAYIAFLRSCILF